ncbi:hypothetical protein CM49_05599 [Paenibacillus sp. P1XP2]|nr:hypothetical protein CM49_05599 [Paenibacillus sp. P1XP2]
MGRHEWSFGQTSVFGGADTRMASSFTWRSPDELLLTIRGIETPFCITMGVRFTEEALEIRHRFNVSFGGDEEHPIRGKAAR